jgi:F0F1-type ATP synthase gamma subunit
MELANIERLLVKYENAETTLKEEDALRTYFASNKVAPHLKEYHLLFNYFKSNTDKTYTKKIILNTKIINNNWRMVAASLILLLGTYSGLHIINEYNEKKQAAENLAQITNVLKLVSTSLNKGNQALKRLHVYEDSVNKIFKNNK